MLRSDFNQVRGWYICLVPMTLDIKGSFAAHPGQPWHPVQFLGMISIASIHQRDKYSALNTSVSIHELHRKSRVAGVCVGLSNAGKRVRKSPHAYP